MGNTLDGKVVESPRGCGHAENDNNVESHRNGVISRAVTDYENNRRKVEEIAVYSLLGLICTGVSLGFLYRLGQTFDFKPK